MKKIILVLALLISSVAMARVFEERNVTNSGQPIVRYYNAGSYPVSCYYRDSSGYYYLFVLRSKQYSMWIPVRGAYESACK